MMIITAVAIKLQISNLSFTTFGVQQTIFFGLSGCPRSTSSWMPETQRRSRAGWDWTRRPYLGRAQEPKPTLPPHLGWTGKEAC